LEISLHLFFDKKGPTNLLPHYSILKEPFGTSHAI
jgi:hypothetical protein